MKKIELQEKLGIIILFVVLFLLMFIVPNMNTDMNVGKLIINEIMLVNNNTIMDKYGKYSDYIEIYNGNDYDVDLYGYYLTDSMKETRKWSFPDVTIKANDYMVVFASGKNNVIEEELHTNFKLDSKGETIALSDSSGKVISKVYVKETMKDTSYGYNGEEYVYYYSGTPGKKNEGEFSSDAIYEEEGNKEYKLAITEYMTNNLSNIKAFDDKFYSMIEIHNYGEKDINLKGFYLSNKEDNIGRYALPDVVIKGNDYLSIYASGKDEVMNNEIHTNFKLKNDDGVITLADPKKSLINKVVVQELDGNTSFGYYDDKWHLYSKTSFGKENMDNYLQGEINNNIIINEVSIYPKEAIELKNNSEEEINLDKYSIGDKSGVKTSLKGFSIKKKGFLVLESSKLGFNINNSNEVIYLYYDEKIVDSIEVHKLMENISTGRSNKEKVYYKKVTLGAENSDTYYQGFSEIPEFNVNNGYIDKGDKVTLSVSAGDIYYTTDGTFPSTNSKKYTEPIEIKGNTVIKAISKKEGYLESDIISRTFITERVHDIPFVSISTNEGNLFGYNGIITNYTSNAEKKVNFEYYESDGSLGVSFIGDIKLSGMDSRKEPQKSISVYLRKKYGVSNVTYPFFDDMEYHTYSSLLLRNAGEDPKKVRIMDAALTRTLKGEMDIDMQEYRPVAVYLNGSYYGISNLREKLNGDYVESKFGIDKKDISLIKYSTPTKGNTKEYNELVNYVKNHDVRKSDVYEYLKKEIDVQELINYFIVESFYGNTDLGNIRYWKSKDGKWRWMLYDLDWSLWNMGLDMAYPTKYTRVPAATYLSSSITIVRTLYQNSEFKNLYLKSLAKYLSTTFKPERMEKIIDELAREIEKEMPYHIKRWGGSYPSLSSMNAWKNNINNFKRTINNRYNRVVSNLQSNFNLSNSEYNKYFGELK